VALTAASRATEISLTKAFADLAGTFETRMVIPGSIVVLVTGMVTALVGDVALFGPLQNAPAWPLVGLVLFIAINLLVPTVFLPRGKLFGKALDEAKTRGAVTQGLRLAFADPVVAFAHQVELAGVALIIALMVLKPF
jgi:hypothetical protein